MLKLRSRQELHHDLIKRYLAERRPVSGGLPNTRLPYVHGNLNDADDLTQTGLWEPITKLELPSGCVLGQYADWTDAEVAKYTNAAVGTLYAGRYQRVQLDPALNQATSPLKRGQLLFWVQGTTKWVVTNVEPADVSDIAGIYLNTATAGTFPVTSGDYFWMQVFNGGGEATVLLRSVLTGTPANGQAVYAAGAGAGADNATADVLDGAGNPSFTQVGNMQNRYLGKALALPVAGAVLKISLPTRQDFA